MRKTFWIRDFVENVWILLVRTNLLSSYIQIRKRYGCVWFMTHLFPLYAYFDTWWPNIYPFSVPGTLLFRPLSPPLQSPNLNMLSPWYCSLLYILKLFIVRRGQYDETFCVILSQIEKLFVLTMRWAWADDRSKNAKLSKMSTFWNLVTIFRITMDDTFK